MSLGIICFVHPLLGVSFKISFSRAIYLFYWLIHIYTLFIDTFDNNPVCISCKKQNVLYTSIFPWLLHGKCDITEHCNTSLSVTRFPTKSFQRILLTKLSVVTIWYKSDGTSFISENISLIDWPMLVSGDWWHTWRSWKVLS